MIVRASATGGSDDQALAVTVTNVNEAPMITSNGGAATAAITAPENAATVTTVTALDPEGDVRTYSIVGGADAALFSIDSATGVLTFIAPANFESPADADLNNVYEVTVRASSTGGTDDQALSVTVVDSNEAPVITSNGGGTSANISIAENGTVVTAVTATDAEGDAPFYSISGGADAALFTMDSVTASSPLSARPISRHRPMPARTIFMT